MLIISGSWAVLITLLLISDTVLGSSIRRFAAANKRSHLRRRSLGFAPSRGTQNLLFEDESLTESAVQLSLDPRHPTLILDDLNDLIKDVTCSQSQLVVHFDNDESLLMAVAAWNTDTELAFVSSHPKCASHGEHQAYLAKYISSNGTSCHITFQARRKPLKEMFDRISVDLGRHNLDMVEPKRLRRSESTTTVQSPTGTYNAQTASLPPTVSFDWTAPTATATSTRTSHNVSFSMVNKSVLPPDQAILDLFPGAGVVASVNLECQNCSMTGSIELEAAGFQVNSNILEKAVDFVNNGYFRFAANNLTAYMEYEVGLLPGFGPSFTANLTKIPLATIEIPGLLTFGPVLELTLPMSMVLDTPMNFTGGFKLAVPNNSTIIFNVSHIHSSWQAGFDETSFEVLPFSADVDDFSMNLTTSLQPKLLISAGAGETEFDIGVSGGVGAYLDFPKLNAQIGMVRNVNASCDGPAPKGITNKAVYMSPSASLGVGLDWELDWQLDLATQRYGQAREGEQPLVSKTFNLPSRCLVFDEKTQSLVPANSSNLNPQSSETSTPKPTSKNSAASLNPTMLTWVGLFLTTAVTVLAL